MSKKWIDTEEESLDILVTGEAELAHFIDSLAMRKETFDKDGWEFICACLNATVRMLTYKNVDIIFIKKFTEGFDERFNDDL